MGEEKCDMDQSQLNS